MQEPQTTAMSSAQDQSRREAQVISDSLLQGEGSQDLLEASQKTSEEGSEGEGGVRQEQERGALDQVDEEDEEYQYPEVDEDDEDEYKDEPRYDEKGNILPGWTYRPNTYFESKQIQRASPPGGATMGG